MAVKSKSILFFLKASHSYHSDSVTVRFLHEHSYIINDFVYKINVFMKVRFFTWKI